MDVSHFILSDQAHIVPLPVKLTGIVVILSLKSSHRTDKRSRIAIGTKCQLTVAYSLAMR